jgi:acetyl-CoA C-acetyltransferase
VVIGCEPVIVAAARTPITVAGRGALARVRADALAAHVATAALGRAGALPVDALEDLYLGCALPGGEQGFNLARVVAVLIGLDCLPGATVTRYCASSLQALRMAAHAVAAGEGRAFLVVGVESSSGRRSGDSDSIPSTKSPAFAAATARTGGADFSVAWRDPRQHGALPDVYVDVNRTAEFLARLHGIGRPEQDEVALRSHRMALAAIRGGAFDGEIVPVPAEGEVVSIDGGPRPDLDLAALSRLRPLFPGGTVTAGNCCPLADGAAALVVTDAGTARGYGLPVLARVRASAVSGISPEMMTLGAVDAIRHLLVRAGLSRNDVDAWELNEEYAVQLIASQRLLDLDPERVNRHGGTIALGHPFGMTGIRLVMTLLGVLHRTDGTIGVAATPVGGGQGMAVVLERMS